AEAAAHFEKTLAETARLGARFQVRGRVAYVDARASRGPYDKTELLLLGQARAPIAVVRDSGMITIAAPYDSGWDFVSLLGLGGGMPTRVSIAESRLEDALAAIEAAPLPATSA